MGFRLKPPTLIHGQAPSTGESVLKQLLFLTVLIPFSTFELSVPETLRGPDEVLRDVFQSPGLAG